MTTEDAFLADILAYPADPAPRLIFADWLQDHDDAARAEFVRLQVELAALPPCECSGPADFFLRHLQGYCRRCDLRRKEYDLLAAHGDGWHRAALGPFSERVVWGDFARTFRGGFVEKVALPCADFLLHAGLLFRLAPITEVLLTDREPYQTWAEADRRPVWSWWREGYGVSHNTLPEPLWRILVPPDRPYPIPWERVTVRDFPAPADAANALSRACVILGRRRAELPPLYPPG